MFVMVNGEFDGDDGGHDELKKVDGGAVMEVGWELVPPCIALTGEAT